MVRFRGIYIYIADIADIDSGNLTAYGALPMYIPYVSHDMWKWDTSLQPPRYHINSSTVTLASQVGFDGIFFSDQYP